METAGRSSCTVSTDADKKPPYTDPCPVPLVNSREFGKWRLYRPVIAEFVATLLFVYVTVATIIGHKRQADSQPWAGAGVLGIAWSFGGMIFVLVYCTSTRPSRSARCLPARCRWRRRRCTRWRSAWAPSAAPAS
jgi:hypothetical protein